VLLVYQPTLLTGLLNRSKSKLVCNKSASLLTKHGSRLRTLISESKSKYLICRTGSAMVCLHHVHHELKIWLRGRLKVLAYIESSYSAWWWAVAQSSEAQVELVYGLLIMLILISILLLPPRVLSCAQHSASRLKEEPTAPWLLLLLHVCSLQGQANYKWPL
jgi:hypothetical protein